MAINDAKACGDGALRPRNTPSNAATANGVDARKTIKVSTFDLRRAMTGHRCCPQTRDGVQAKALYFRSC